MNKIATSFTTSFTSKKSIRKARSFQSILLNACLTFKICVLKIKRAMF